MRESASAESKPAAKIKGIDDGDQPLDPKDVITCLKEIQSYSKMQDCVEDFRAAFNLSSTAKLNETFTKVKHQQWLNANASKYVLKRRRHRPCRTTGVVAITFRFGLINS